MTQTVPLSHLASARPTAAECSSRKTLSALALAVAKAKRIVVVTGAGISCSSGIPDFRSSDGLYNLLKSRYPEVVLRGRDLFDAALFRDPTSSAVFYTFMAELKTQIDSARPAPVHDFLATLDAKNKLLRSYTQNIDGLEERAGLRTGERNSAGAGSGPLRPKNVQLHGDIHRVRCTLCSASFACTSEHIDQFRTGTPPDCPECTARSDARTARQCRAIKCGTLRPAIVLYDEPHPLGDDIGAVQTSDLSKKPDLLIVMGTSLKVHGLRKLVKSFAKAVHSSRPSPATSRSLLHNVVFVNRTAPPPGEWTGVIDYHVQGDTDTWVAQVLSEWKKSRPADWEIQSTLDQVADGRIIRGPGSEIEKGSKPKIWKGKSKVGVENTPPEDKRPASQQSRCVVVLPRSSSFKAGTTKSPLQARIHSPLKPLGLSPVKSAFTKFHATVRPCQLGMSSPRRLGMTSLKRPAPSPLAPRPARLDTSFGRSPGLNAGTSDATDSNAKAATLVRRPSSSRSDSTLSSASSSSSDESPLATDLASGPSSSSTSPSLMTSALSSQADLVASQSQGPSSQTSQSTVTSCDSIFSSQPSAASSQATSVSCSQPESSAPKPDVAPKGSANISSTSPRLDLRHHLPPTNSSPYQRFRVVPRSNAGSEWVQCSPSAERPERPPRATTIPIPGRDFVITKHGEKTPTSRDQVRSMSVSGTFFSPTKRYVNSIKSPGILPRLSYWEEGSPRKKGRVSDEWQEVDDEAKELYTTEDEEPKLLFPGEDENQGVGDMSMDDVIDLDPDDELDGAVGHMSLDGPGDTDMEMEPVVTQASVFSPVQTRAKRRAKEQEAAVVKRRSKKAARPRVMGTRTSSRIAALAS